MKERLTVLGIPRAEAVELVAGMKTKGMLATEIARQLGVAYSTVAAWIDDPDLTKQKERREGYRRPCSWCGKLLCGSWGRQRNWILCRSCTNVARAKWTRETVIAAIQKFAEVYGRAPSASEFTPSILGHRSPDARLRCEAVKATGDWPNWGTVQALFGTWNAALVAAGLPPRRVGHYITDSEAA